MDLPAMRRLQITQKALQHLEKHNGDRDLCRYADQDGLNVAANGNWQRFPETWNFNIYHIMCDPSLLPEQRKRILTEGPAIVHYASRKKPWMRQFPMPFQREFLRHASDAGIQYPLPSWRCSPWRVVSRSPTSTTPNP